MNRNPDRGRIAAYYDRLVDEHGHSVRARDAVRESSLLIRYQVLSEVFDLSGKRVLEVGCGFGDLGAFLKARYQDVEYVGVDISSRMIEVGRSVYPDLDLRHEDILDWPPNNAFDVVLAQGIFYLLGDNAEQKMFRLVQKMFDLVKEALAFCTLSAWAPTRNHGEFYANPVKLLEFCRRLTPWLVLRHDYHPGDVTMYLYKREGGSHEQQE